VAKTTAPLLSFGADGQIAKTAVYSKWKGIPYVRRYTIPANPRTTRQMVTRNMFKVLNQIWLLMPSVGKEPWNARATGQPFTGVNAFIKANIAGVDTSTPPTDWSGFVGSAGSKGGLPPASLALAPGVDSIAATLAAPPIPPDWTIAEAQGVAFFDGDPQVDLVGTVTATTDAAAPYVLNFTGLTGVGDYVVSAWFKWNRPDGTYAYSTSLTDLATPT
jgi:hypothetical protein